MKKPACYDTELAEYIKTTNTPTVKGFMEYEKESMRILGLLIADKGLMEYLNTEFSKL